MEPRNLCHPRPFQPHPPTHPHMKLDVYEDRGHSVQAGLRRTLFNVGFVLGMLERKAINT